MVASDEEIRQVAEEIGRRFQPEQVILFGSRARGTATPESDVDLLVVMAHPGSDRQQAYEVLRAVDRRFPLDVIVRSPRELERRLKLGDFFLRDIIREGKVLYERSH